MPNLIASQSLGAASFRSDHATRLACVAGGMVKGIASTVMIKRLAEAGLLGFLGTGGMNAGEIESTVADLARALGRDRPWGVNFLHNFVLPEAEEILVDCLLRHDVGIVEASAFIAVTPALVRYRLTGLSSGPQGEPIRAHRVMAKVSRSEVANAFLRPAAPAIVEDLLSRGQITGEQARLAALVPMADDLSIEADSGGHTDRRVALTLVPSMIRLRDSVAREFAPAGTVRVGAGGGIGCPEAAAAALMLGADYILTGSINQCTPEAGTSDLVKDMLQGARQQDFTMAPAGDMFEIGAKVQVLRRGTMFAARANRLYDLYRTYPSLDAMPVTEREEIERRVLGRSIDAVWRETEAYYARAAPSELALAHAQPRKKMAMVFRWYFIHTNRLALAGEFDDRANFQIHSGPAMAACNDWLRGTELENWRTRHVDILTERLMAGTAAHLSEKLTALTMSAEQSGARARPSVEMPASAVTERARA
jgi:trans-AT polyketide synthase/acyltransferase/oxidoreductase domain-containing protein